MYVSGAWVILPETVTNLVGFTTSPESRALSVNLLPGTNSSEFCLIFEDSNGKVMILHGLESSTNPWTWKNLTETLSSSHPNITLSSPFTSGVVNVTNVAIDMGLGSLGLALEIVFYNPSPNYNIPLKYPGLTLYYSNGNFTKVILNHLSLMIVLLITCTTIATGFISYTAIPTNFTAIEKPDFVQATKYTSGTLRGSYGLWVNGTTLSYVWIGYLEDFGGVPISPCPYTRLATTTPNGSTAFYMYHQINVSTMAEDIWDSGRATWSSTNISIATA